VPTIIARLPLAQACTHAQLKTVVAFKEGISHSRPDVQACADNIVGAWPVAWEGPSLSSSAAELAIEMIELAHHGITVA
jgi:hypothetical protein